MKQLFFLIATLFIAGLSAFSQEGTFKTDTVKVSGNCEMCQQRIITAAKIKGVQTVSWNIETQMLLVTYDTSRITLGKIEQRIAAAGHDTEHFKAPEGAYKALHKCCRYVREQ